MEESEREFRREKREMADDAIRRAQEKRIVELQEKGRQREEMETIRERDRLRMLEQKEELLRERAEAREEKIKQIQQEQQELRIQQKMNAEKKEVIRSQLIGKARIENEQAQSMRQLKNKTRYGIQSSNLKELEEKKRLEILERQKLVEKKKQQIEMEREKWLEESKVRAAEREMTIRRVLDFNRTLEIGRASCRERVL